MGDTIELWWALPDGGTPENVTWPQTLVDPSAVPCDTWTQIDTYIPSEAATFAADGVLAEGEDYPSDVQTGAIQWRFELYGGDCVPVPTPIDLCPNVDDYQLTIPEGMELSNGLCVPADVAVPGDTYVPPAPEVTAPPVVTTDAVTTQPVVPMLAETGEDFSPMVFTGAMVLILLGVIVWSMGRKQRKAGKDD